MNGDDGQSVVLFDLPEWTNQGEANVSMFHIIFSAIFVVFSTLVGIIWRDLNTKVTEATKAIRDSSAAVLAEKVRRLEVDYQLLHMWKNTIYPEIEARQYENIMRIVHRIESEQNKRLDRLERFANGKLGA